MKANVTCPLCEAMCGLRIEVEHGAVTRIAGDPEDALSLGFLCPKALALKDVAEDPERLRRPLRRDGNRWQEVSWENAFAEVADRLNGIRARHGSNAVAFYTGNPNVHSYTAQFAELEFAKRLGTRLKFSTASMDHLPHLLVSYLMFGHQYLLPIPDVDRTDFLLVIGANPAESNGSLLGAPGMPRRLREIRSRGRVVVVDPRRTKTALLADTHFFIRPGTDAYLLMALVHTLFEERLVRLGRLANLVRDVHVIEKMAQPYSPERVAGTIGIDAESVRGLARDFVSAPSAVCYGRVGACTQEFGALTCWLVQVLNVLTGNFDRPGGAMFSKPAVDIVKIGHWTGRAGSYASWRSRVSRFPEFDGELPVAALAEEIDTPGEQQVRALVTSAGNPVLSTPNGSRLERALPLLDFMVSIDFYVNETTAHADFILPPTFALERDHYDLALRPFGARNTVRYNQRALDPAQDSRSDWDIYMELVRRLKAPRTIAGLAGEARRRLLVAIGPQRMLDLMLRIGPYGAGFGRRKGLTLRKLEQEAHTRDLGPLQPCLPDRLYTRDRTIHLAPEILLRDIPRLESLLTVPHSNSGHLQMIGRRQLRSNNSWMHNTQTLANRPDRCTLMIHPDDAGERSLTNGQIVRISSRAGRVVAPVEISDSMMKGIVSLPHGYGHSRSGTCLSLASRMPGVSLNDITDEKRFDAVSGTVAFSGVPVTIEVLENPDRMEFDG